MRPLAEAVLGGVRAQGLPEHPDIDAFRGVLGRVVPQWRTAQSEDDGSLVILGEAFLRLVRVLGGRKGCLLVLEDLHWADPETFGVVEYLADNLADEPTLLLGTLRPEDSTGALTLSSALQARGAAELVPLPRLKPAQVTRMIRACLGGDPAPEEVDAFVRARADGLPFFVEELLTGLTATDALRHQDGRWLAISRLTPRVPLTFAEGVSRRLSGLGRDARMVVDVAAVMGRRFEWALLGSVTGLDEARLLAALRRGVETQILVAEPDGFLFRHALTRDVVLAELLPPELARLAQRAADALEAADPELDGPRCELAAELRERAGQHRRASELLHRAAQRALTRGALATAEATLRQARALAGNDPARLANLDETLVEVLGLAGKTGEALEVGTALLGQLTAIDAEPARRTSARLRLARAAVTAGRWPQATAHLDAVAGLGDTPAIDALRAHVAIGEGRMDEAASLALRAVEAAERLGQHEVACEALEVVGRAARLRDLTAAEAAFERAYRIADAHSLTVWRIRALHELGTIDLLDEGEPDRLEAAREAAIAAGALATAAVVDLQLVGSYWIRHDVERLLRVTTRCVAASRRLRLPILAKALLDLAGVHAVAGRREAMEEALAEARAVAPGDPEVDAGTSGNVYACWWLREADDTRAAEALESAMLIYRDHPTLPCPFRGMWALLRTVMGNGEEAREEVRASSQLTMRVNRRTLLYADAVALGQVGRRVEAAESFAAAEAAVRIPGSWDRQHALRLVAGAALRDGWGEPVAWLRQALAWFDDRNYERAASACRALLRQASVAVPRRGRGDARVPDELRAFGVTSREMDVLRLVAAGLSNPEIAAELYLSPRTVDNHVGRLLSRTGARGRARLAALVTRAER